MASLIGILALIAAGVGVIGWLWIVVTAFSEGEIIWGIGCLIISPLSIVYGLLNFDELKIPLFLVAGGLIARVGLGAMLAFGG